MPALGQLGLLRGGGNFIGGGGQRRLPGGDDATTAEELQRLFESAAPAPVGPGVLAFRIYVEGHFFTPILLVLWDRPPLWGEEYPRPPLGGYRPDPPEF